MARLLVATTIPRFLDDFLLPYASHFRSKAWQVDALTGPGIEKTAAARAFHKSYQVEWSRNPLDVRNLVATPRRIREAVVAGRYDLVHVHTPIAAFVTRLALRSLPTAIRPQLIYTAHGFHFHPGGSLARNGAFLALEKLGGRWTDYLVVLNRQDEAMARRHRLLPPDRIRRMPGIGIDTARFSRSRLDPAALQRVRHELGIPRDAPYFLMLAEFVANKRHVDLVRALARLANGTSQAPHLVLAGQGPLLSEVRALARSLGIEQRVHTPGHRSDTPVLLGGASALVLPSGREGLPCCILEAMAMRVPVVASRIRGCSDLLEGGAGALFEVGDVEGLANALGSTLVNQPAVEQMASLAHQRVAAYDTRHVIRLHEQLYEEALARSMNQGLSPDPSLLRAS